MMVNIKIKDINKIINKYEYKYEWREGLHKIQNLDKDKTIYYIKTEHSKVLGTFLDNLTYDIVELEVNKEDDSKTGGNISINEVEFKLKYGQVINLKLNEEIIFYAEDEEEIISKFQIEIGYSPIIRATVPINEHGLIKEYLFDSRDIISISYNRDDEDDRLQLL